MGRLAERIPISTSTSSQMPASMAESVVFKDQYNVRNEGVEEGKSPYRSHPSSSAWQVMEFEQCCQRWH